MPSHNSPQCIKTYVSTVCQQIRWKKAHPRVADELSSHISDATDTYISQGLPEADAIAQAINDTGDASLIGAQLDRVHRPKPQWGMLGTTAALVVLGLAIYGFFAGGMSANRLLFTGIGAAGLVAAYFIDFTWIVKYPKTLLFAALAIAVVMWPLHFYLQLGTVIFTDGAGIWFHSRTNMAAFLLTFPLVLAVIIFYAKGKGYWGLTISGLSFTLLTAVASGISVVGAVRFGVIGVVLLGIAIAKDMFRVRKLSAALTAFAPPVLLGLPFVVAFAINEFQRQIFLQRVMVFFNPSVAPETRGFWPLMTRGILRDAVWFGRGESEWLSIMLWQSSSPPMPVESISVLTVLIGLMGWVAFVIVVGVVVFFIAKGMTRCLRQKSNLGLLVSSAVLVTFAAQAVEYVTFNLGFQMASPISLPLIVSGNAPLVVNMVLIGFMLSVFRTGDAVVDRHYDTRTGKLICWEDGKLIIQFRPAINRLHDNNDKPF